jgi:pseudouridine kinase
MDERPSILVVGGANLDIQARSDAPFRSGDSNPGRAWPSAGGVGRNIAECAARLGASVELFAPLGDDDAARTLASACGLAGVGTDRCPRIPGARTGRYVCLLDADGTLVGAVSDMEVMELLAPADLEAAIPLIDAALIVVADANLRADTLARLFDLAARVRKPVYLDTVSEAKARRIAGLAGRAALVKPNRAEASALTGWPVRTPSEAAAAARELRRRGTGEVFLSMGVEGLLWLGEASGGLARLPGRREAVNVSGAGDAALAALARWSRSGRSAAERAALALAAAALAAASPSTAPEALDEHEVLRLAQGVEHEPLP